jgi:Pyruvate/2-oxoacid:ferredoxin oxidoreductase delta subunit
MKWVRVTFQVGFFATVLVSVFLLRANCEAWCPFGGVELLCTYLPERALTCSLASSNLFVMLCLLGVTLLVGRAFCGWLCPLGALSGWAGALGIRLFGVRWNPPRGLDVALSLLKYPVTAIILYFTYKVGELVFRGFDPCYALISRHGEDITFWAYVVLGGLVAASLFMSLPFCRYLCPLAAVLNLFSPFRILKPVRDPEVCTDCGACDQACPMAIPVSRVEKVSHARCTSCVKCIEVCPQGEAGALTLRAPLMRGRALWVVIPVLLILAAAGSAALGRRYPIPTVVRERGGPASALAAETFQVRGLECRHRALGFCRLLFERDDEYALAGYLRVECFAAPGTGRAVITFEAGKVTRENIVNAFARPLINWEDLTEQPTGYGPGG